MLNIGIIGTGAVAQTLGFFLRDHSLYFFARKGPKKLSYKVTENGSVHNITAQLHTNKTPLDICFVCTKAFDVEAAVKQHNKVVGASTYVVLSNGWLGPLLDNLSSVFPVSRFLQGVCYLGSTQKNAAVTDILSKESVIYLPNDKQISPLQNNYLQCTDRFSIYRDQKFFYNLVLNSMTAAYRYPYNGMVLKNQEMFVEIAKESYALLQELTGERSLAFKNFSQAQQSLKDFTQQVYWNQNSMYVDIEHRRMTETGFLAGRIVGLCGYPLLKELHSYLALQ